ncbi:MAG: PIN domain-containing protein [Thermoplasmata archaeon]|nr:PIN domain-containing protein [Thermoplasmata archaeon]
MKRVVVDANVLIACLVADGRTREVFLRSGDVRFIVPTVIFDEVDRHLAEIASRAQVPLETSRALLRELAKNMEPIPQALWDSALPRATELAREVRALNDEPYIALALVQSAPIWSFDKALRRLPGVRILSTSEVEALTWE